MKEGPGPLSALAGLDALLRSEQPLHRPCGQGNGPRRLLGLRAASKTVSSPPSLADFQRRSDLMLHQHARRREKLLLQG